MSSMRYLGVWGKGCWNRVATVRGAVWGFINRGSVVGRAVWAAAEPLERRVMLAVSVTATPSSTEILAGSSINLSVSASVDGSGTSLDDTYSVNWGDGNTDYWNGGWSGSGSGTSSDTPSHTFTSASPSGWLGWPVEVDVTEDGGTNDGCDIVWIKVDPNTPTVSAWGSSSVQAASTYTLSTSFSDPDGDSVNDWEINWGDGNSETDSPASGYTHVYRNDGYYTISVTAQDNDGNWPANNTYLTVTNPASTDPYGYDGMHYFNQAPFSAPDTSAQVSQANPQSTGTSDAVTTGGVRVFDGNVVNQATDLSSNAFGRNWSVTRTWSPDMAGTGTLGNHWYLNQVPELVHESRADANRPSGATDTIILVAGGTDQRWFDLISGSWVERYGGQDTLATGTDPDSASVYILTDTLGTQTHFYDFSTTNAAQAGQFRSSYDPAGNVIKVNSVNSSGQITEVRRSNGSNIESWVYTYSSIGGNSLITNIELRQSTNSGSTWTAVRQVAYSYYSSGNAGGNVGDLKTATIEDGSGNPIGTSYYRYWLGTEHVTEGGSSILQPADALKYVFTPASYARMYAALPSGTTPDSATDAELLKLF